MDRLGKLAGEDKALTAMSLQKLWEKSLMNRAFTILQCCELSLIVIDQHHFMPEFGKTCSRY
jgi:hypothetical protein